jgi:hypothetical protein
VILRFEAKRRRKGVFCGTDFFAEKGGIPLMKMDEPRDTTGVSPTL